YNDADKPAGPFPIIMTSYLILSLLHLSYMLIILFVKNKSNICFHILLDKYEKYLDSRMKEEK
ncbi:hypothetical protein, partial [Alkalibaculum bacchi]|uniref:hypothetical protein n=1 Tax=Alkalibaculum bacchi TaxID=645887 RepID=UPI0026EDB3A1